MTSTLSVHCRDIGIDYPHEVTGMDERDLVRNFITFAESELRMPVLTADTLYRIHLKLRE